MSEDTDSGSHDQRRRTVLKALGAGGLAAAGVGASTGSAAAQGPLNIDADNLIAQSGQLLSITVQNVNVLNDSLNNLEDLIDVTIGDVNVEVISVDNNTIIVDIENVLNNLDLNVLNNVDVQVAVLSRARQVTGSDTVEVVQP